MSIFDKCYQYTAPDEVRAMGLYPYFRPIESEQDTWVILRGKKVLMLGSNSYLGLTNDPRIKEAAMEAVRRFGSGCAGSRFLNGTLTLHEELERELAEFVGKESALLYTTGFQVNLGVISTLVSRGDYILVDRLDHASIIDGARLAFGKVIKFKHNDMADLERVLSGLEEGTNKLIVVDGIFSMEGDIADLPNIVALAKKYKAEIMVDDAHSIGVLGPNGEGTSAHFNLTEHVDLIMGTFSKSLATIGGFVAGPRAAIEYLKHNSRALIFSASPAPAQVAAARKALEIIKKEPERRERLWHNTNKLRAGLQSLGYDTGVSCTPIIPVKVGEMMTAFKMCRMLEDEGVFVNPVVPPAVPPGDCLIRASLMATHTDEQIDFALEIFERVGKKLGII